MPSANDLKIYRRRSPLLGLVRVALAAVVALGLIACSGGGGSNGESGDDPGSGLEAPAAPTGLEATSQDGAIGLSWDSVGRVDSYRVYRSTSSGVDVSGSPLDSGISSADYTDETAENGAKYYYVVTTATNRWRRKRSNG